VTTTTATDPISYTLIATGGDVIGAGQRHYLWTAIIDLKQLEAAAASGPPGKGYLWVSVSTGKASGKGYTRSKLIDTAVATAQNELYVMCDRQGLAPSNEIHFDANWEDEMLCLRAELETVTDPTWVSVRAALAEDGIVVP
jgi:hypothetical protein